MPVSERVRNIVAFLNGFRKFTIMFILISIGVTFRLTNHLTGTELVDLLSGATVAFMSANSVEHIGKSVVEWLKRKDA